MQEYDIILKKLLRESASLAVSHLAGVEIVRWLDVEFPQPRNPRADLVGESADGILVHIELQSTNDPEMAGRMFDYCAGIFPPTGDSRTKSWSTWAKLLSECRKP